MEPFTAEAARQAAKQLTIETDPAALCDSSTPSAQRLIEAEAQREHGLEDVSCDVAAAALLRDENSPGQIDRAEREDLEVGPEMDRRTQTAAFIDEFGNGIVLTLIQGQWLFAGVVTR